MAFLCQLCLRASAPARPLALSVSCAPNYEKGCEVVLAAMQHLPQELNFELTVVGKGPLKEHFKSAAEKDKRLRFLGYVSGEQKTEIFSQSDCLIIHLYGMRTRLSSLSRLPRMAWVLSAAVSAQFLNLSTMKRLGLLFRSPAIHRRSQQR